MTRVPQLIASLGRIGLGFCSVPRDKLADPDSEDNEAEDLDAGSIGRLELDLDFEEPRLRMPYHLFLCSFCFSFYSLGPECHFLRYLFGSLFTFLYCRAVGRG